MTQDVVVPRVRVGEDVLGRDRVLEAEADGQDRDPGDLGLVQGHVPGGITVAAGAGPQAGHTGNVVNTQGPVPEAVAGVRKKKLVVR